MILYNKQYLTDLASKYHFIRDDFEKILRLNQILRHIGQDKFLGNNLALKGGTCINMVFSKLLRLSIDIDFDIADNFSKDEILSLRKNIQSDINDYMISNNYKFDIKNSRSRYSLDSLVYMFKNSGGINSRLKIEINFSSRCHILPLERNLLFLINETKQIDILTLNPIEVFASKTKALLSRGTARDLYDLYNIIKLNMIKEDQFDLFRKCVVFYMACDFNLIDINYDQLKINKLRNQNIKEDLQNLLIKGERFDLNLALCEVKNFLSQHVLFNDDEIKFLNDLNNGKYYPEILFDGEILKRIQNHPMIEWKLMNFNKNIELQNTEQYNNSDIHPKRKRQRM